MAWSNVSYGVLLSGVLLKHREGARMLKVLVFVIAFALPFAETEPFGSALAQSLDQTEPSAQGLDQALAQFYTSNPTLQSLQMSVGSQNEAINQVSGAAMPQVNLGVTTNPTRTYGYGLSSGTYIANNGNLGLSLNVTQAIDLSGSIGTQIDAAYLGLENGWIAYYAQEQGLMLEAIRSYMNMISTRAHVSLSKAAVDLLKAQLDAARVRYDAGVGTGTDVANINASYQGARAQLTQATGNRSVAEAEYRRIFGTLPGKLRFPDLIPNLPSNVNQAVERAMHSAPALVQAEAAVEIEKLDIEAAKASNGPSMNLTASASHSYDLLETSNDHSTNFSAGGQLNFPLYQGGAGKSRVRQAELDYQTAVSNFEAQRDITKAQVISAWQNYKTLETVMSSIVSQVEAAELALRRARAEQEAGTKTFIDTLEAENSLTSAQVNMAATRANVVIAGYALLQATGDLTAEKLRLPVAAYFSPRGDLDKRFVPNLASAIYLPAGENRSTVTPDFIRWLTQN